MIILALLSTMALAQTPIPTPTATPTIEQQLGLTHLTVETGPLCIEQKYGCPATDKECKDPILYQSIVKECSRTKKAKKAMKGVDYEYLKFTHVAAEKPKAAPINQNVRDGVAPLPEAGKAK